MSKISKWIDDAYKYYDHMGLIPDIDDIVEDVVESWEYETGLILDDMQFRRKVEEIGKEVRRALSGKFKTKSKQNKRRT